jgi:hypothetical protein
MVVERNYELSYVQGLSMILMSERTFGNVLNLGFVDDPSYVGRKGSPGQASELDM